MRCCHYNPTSESDTHHCWRSLCLRILQLAAIKKRLATARTAGEQNHLKQQAMQLLKRRQLYENQRGMVQQRAFNLEQTTFALDNIRGAQEHAAALKASAGALKAASQQVDLDELEDLHDDIADLLVDAEEVNELLGRDYGVGAAVNEDDLDSELHAPFCCLSPPSALTTARFPFPSHSLQESWRHWMISWQAWRSPCQRRRCLLAPWQYPVAAVRAPRRPHCLHG